MELPAWIPVTIFAAAMQASRTALQANLKGVLSAGGSSFVRYLYALPVDVLLLLVVWWSLAQPAAPWAPEWVLWCLIGGVSQIFGTYFLVRAFHSRNFVVGTAYAKTEAVQLVLISVLVFGIELPPLAVVGVMVAVVGVMWLSVPAGRFTLWSWAQASAQPAALFGLAAGFGFAGTALALRAASESMDATVPVLFKAMLILLVTNSLQTLIQGAWLAVTERAEWGRVLREWRRAAPVGVLSALGSGAWFTAFSLTQVALVRGLGQIELLFTLVLGHFLLRERFAWREAAGLLVLSVGVALIALAELI